MKLKNLLSLFLVFIFAFATVGVSAANEEIELFTNGGCEMLDLTSWDTGGNAGCGISDEIARTGKYSCKVTYPSAEGTGIVGVANFDPFVGATYTFTAWVYVDKKITAESRPGIQMIFQSSAGYLHVEETKLEGVQEGKWYQSTVTATAPAGTEKLTLHTRMYGGGTYYWDDSSLKVSGDKKTMAAYKEQVDLEQRLLDEANASFDAQVEKAFNTEMIEGTENIIPNGSFEDGEGVAATGWQGYQGGWTITQRTDEEARTGNYSMKLDTRGSDRAPYGPFAETVIFIEDGLIPGQQYVFSAWVKVKEYSRGGGAFLKIEPYSARYSALNTMLATSETDFYRWEEEDPNGEDWHLIRTVLEVEEETKMLAFLIRIKGEGVVYYDDISFGLADGGTRFDMYATRAFNYVEDGYGTAVAKLNTAGFAIVPNSTMEFALKDGDTVLDSASIPAAATVTWNFDVNKMPEELTAYTLEATYKDAAGNPIGDSVIKRVYKTHRPAKINENGNYIDENGEIFYPVIAYGDAHDYWQDKEIHGINVFKQMVTGYDLANIDEGIDKLKKMLDDGLKEGVKFCIQFAGTEPNAYPSKSQKQMEAFLDKCANHPAIFAYFLIDEVSLKIQKRNKIKTYDYMEYWLEQSYIQVRKKDTVNPIFLLDTGERRWMERSSRIGDIFATDPYPGEESAVPGYSYIRARWSTVGNNFQTPNAVIVQMTPFKDGWRPSPTAIRHQYYQSFWGGAKMLGFFSLTGASDMTLESIKDDSERYEELCKFYNTGEQEIAFEHFTTPNTTLIASWQENDVWYRIWQDKNGQDYLLLMNMTAAELEATGKLVSNNGKVSVDGYTAELVNGADMPKTLSSSDNTFTVKMPSIGVGLYKLTPNNELDLSKLSEDVYADIAGYDWAKKEIETLAMKDIANAVGGAFAPGENITRADFAGFLIRSLGLTADASSTFDDIDPNHYYAKEIAMGKALGILTGVGNNLYNPNEAISRQDVMTICARGMEIAGTLDTTGSLVRLSSFTDSSLFADYAALHASKMVIEGVVKGNPDQTINPLGNTTRAEAAVMMYRIIYKGQIKTKA
ncbi:MAG: S-layer homology domain-containing protein [Clostridia bacterium]|nr:S-layer homology domain-containing protein [Clostridia bacterium]